MRAGIGAKGLAVSMVAIVLIFATLLLSTSTASAQSQSQSQICGAHGCYTIETFNGPTPALVPQGNCTLLNGFAIDGDNYLAVIHGPSFYMVLNYIDTNYVNLTINGQQYNLVHQVTQAADNELMNVTLLGVNTTSSPNTANLRICYLGLLGSAPVQQAPPVGNVPVVAVGASSQGPLTIPANNILAFGGLVLAGAGTAKIRRRLIRGRKQHMELEPGFARRIEEAGVIEFALFIGVVVSLAYNYLLLTAIFAFAFGVGFTYIIDKIRSNDSFDEFVYVRKEGVMRFVEEFGVVEGAMLFIAVYSMLAGLYYIGIVFAFGFGVALAYFADRVREIRDLQGTQAPNSGEGPYPNPSNEIAGPSINIAISPLDRQDYQGSSEDGGKKERQDEGDADKTARTKSDGEISPGPSIVPQPKPATRSRKQKTLDVKPKAARKRSAGAKRKKKQEEPAAE